MTCKEKPKEITAYYDELLEADGSFQVEGCSMQLEVDTDAESLDAHVQLAIQAIRPISRLRFSLSRTFYVIAVHGSPAISHWYRRGNEVTAVLQEKLLPGQRVTLTFDYEGPIRVHSGYGQVLCAVERTGAFLTEWWFPWMRGIKASFNVTLQVPDGMQAVANAQLVRRQESNFEWKSDVPLSDFEIAVGNYINQTQKTESGITVQCFCYEEDARHAPDFMQVMIHSIDLWNDRFGPGPWREVQLVEIPYSYRGGRGPAPMVWFSVAVFTSKNKRWLARDVAHELAHHWWGNLVRGTGPAGLFLQEGVATYSELLYVEAVDGREAYHRAARNLVRMFYRRVKGKKQASLVELGMDDPLMYYILYWKGALILYRLRESMSEEVFLDMLRSFCENYQSRPATVEDFRRHAEEVSGFDLTAYFQSAFHEIGLPSRRLIRR